MLCKYILACCVKCIKPLIRISILSLGPRQLKPVIQISMFYCGYQTLLYISACCVKCSCGYSIRTIFADYCVWSGTTVTLYTIWYCSYQDWSGRRGPKLLHVQSLTYCLNVACPLCLVPRPVLEIWAQGYISHQSWSVDFSTREKEESLRTQWHTWMDESTLIPPLLTRKWNESMQTALKQQVNLKGQ